MRRALNENPVVQAVVIGVMALLVAFLLFTRVVNQGGGGDAAPADSAATDTPPASTPAPAGGAATPAPADTAAAAPAPEAAPAAPAAPATPPAGDAKANFVAGPGLPENVVSAYGRNQAVALFIEKRKGLDDKALKASVRSLEARGDTTTFVVPVKDVAKYARITEGVDLDRTPALVIVRPRKLTNGVPEATVSYGFRGPESVTTAVEDALYDGKTRGYDP
jgi:hypothetical protein